jgi:hypothetical protein
MANREWMRIDAKAGRAWEAPVCLTQSTLRAPRLKSPCCIVEGDDAARVHCGRPPSHFAQLFRRETGLSPSGYRRQR